MPVPPLPEGISSRLKETIDPRTGRCRHHPNVQLCELIQGGTRWAVRRKICYKCGSRNGSSGGRHHRPGVAVRNPESDRGRGTGGGSGGNRRASSAEPAASGRAAARGQHGSSRRNLGSSACLERSNHRMLRSMHNLHNNAPGDDVGGLGAPRRKTSASMHDVTSGTDFGRRPVHAAPGPSVPSPSVPDGRRTSSFHGRALEFTSRAMAEADGPPGGVCRDVVVRRAPPSPDGGIGGDEGGDDGDEGGAGFDESDPVIMVPVLSVDGSGEMPPPPPRSAEELERHRERLELRRAHIRREREERRRRRRKSGDGGRRGSGTRASGGSDTGERSRDPPGTPDPTSARSPAAAKRERSRGRRVATEGTPGGCKCGVG